MGKTLEVHELTRVHVDEDVVDGSKGPGSNCEATAPAEAVVLSGLEHIVLVVDVGTQRVVRVVAGLKGEVQSPGTSVLRSPMTHDTVLGEVSRVPKVWSTNSLMAARDMAGSTGRQIKFSSESGKVSCT